MSDTPLPNLADAYDVRRDDRDVWLTPLPHVGPGRTARFALLCGTIFGVACLGGAIYAGITFQAKFAEGGFGPPPWLGWLFPGGWLLFPLAGLTFAGCVKLYRGLHRPLSVEGRVRYGPQELVPLDEAAAVHVERLSHMVSSDSGPDQEIFVAHLYIATKEGNYVELPKPYFSNLDSWELAEALGRELANALRVPCLLESPPGMHSTPARHARRGKRALGCFVWLIGVPHFIGGFGLVSAVGLARVGLIPPMPKDAPPWAFGLIFVGSGTLLCWLGCRCWGGSVRILLAVLALLVMGGLVAVHHL